MMRKKREYKNKGIGLKTVGREEKKGGKRREKKKIMKKKRYR